MCVVWCGYGVRCGVWVWWSSWSWFVVCLWCVWSCVRRVCGGAARRKKPCVDSKTPPCVPACDVFLAHTEDVLNVHTEAFWSLHKRATDPEEEEEERQRRREKVLTCTRGSSKVKLENHTFMVRLITRCSKLPSSSYHEGSSGGNTAFRWIDLSFATMPKYIESLHVSLHQCLS